MKNGFKDNPMACGLLGIIIGSLCTLAGQAIFTRSAQTVAPTAGLYGVGPDGGKTSKDLTNFDCVPYDESGDVYITENGKKYHDRYCSSLSKSKNIRQVNSADAEAAEIGPCSRCQ